MPDYSSSAGPGKPKQQPSGPAVQQKDQALSSASLLHGPTARMKWLWPKKVGLVEHNKAVANAQDRQDLNRLQESVPR
jgi:hypothetical protein